MSKQHWGSGSIYARKGSSFLWISYPCNGKQRKESSKSANPAAAAKLLRQRLSELGAHGMTGQTFAKVTVSDLLDDLYTDYEVNGKSVAWCELVIRCHLRPFFGMRRATAIGSELIAQYVKSRRARGVKNSTINRELALLRRAFNLGAACEPPKVLRVPKIHELEENNVRKGFFTEEHFGAVMAKLSPEIGAVVEFAYYTGCRRGEILSLLWDQYDEKGGVIRLNPGETKNKDARVIPLSPELAELLKRLKKERDESWAWSKFIFTRGGDRIRSFRGAWLAAVGADDEGKRFFHDLRRTGVRNLIRSGVPEKVAMMISGHKTRSVLDRYHIVQEDDLKEAMLRVSRHLKAQREKE